VARFRGGTLRRAAAAQVRAAVRAHIRSAGVRR
jgi:hypothetical protein